MKTNRKIVGTLLLVMVLVFFAIPGFSQTRVSKPGEYSGYWDQIYDGCAILTISYRSSRTPKRIKTCGRHLPSYKGRSSGYYPAPVIWQHHSAALLGVSDGSMSLTAVNGRMVNLTKYGYIISGSGQKRKRVSYGSMIGYHSRMKQETPTTSIEWLGTQPWSDGNVGMYGCSITGEVIDSRFDNIETSSPQAVFPGNYSFNKYDGFLRGGIQRELGGWS
jgi:hypothetical protein